MTKSLKNHFFPCFVILALTIWIEYSLVYIYPTYQFQSFLRSSHLTKQDPQQSSEFHYQNGRNYLQQLTKFGARITGSLITEREIPSWLVETVKQIQKDHPNAEMKIEVDIQRPASHFPLDFLGGIHNVYNNVTNVIVRITWPKYLLSESSNGILINAHYDSIPTSQGAADDAVGVAVMLEMIRALSHSQKPLQYPLLLLFNGAEEWNHQAAHGFISQHPWAQQVKYLINLEATGTGGRELVFQCNSGELAHIYGNSVPFPQASVMAHELFKVFLHKVASTDWSTIIKYGPKGIRGIDTAYVDNGYVYHTTFDGEEMIPDATIYSTGQNILHLTRALGDEEQLKKYAYNTKNLPEDENAVFFDLFFLQFIIYSGYTVYFFHSLIVFFGTATVIYLVRQSKGRITTRNLFHGIRDELYALGSIILSAVVYGIITHFLYPMRWYDGGLIIAGIEFIPFILFVTIWVRGYLINQAKAYTNPLLRQLSSLSFWLILSFFCVVFGVMSGFIACLWVLFISLASLVYWHVKKNTIHQFRLHQTLKKDDTSPELDEIDLCISDLFTWANTATSTVPPSLLSYLSSAEFLYLVVLAPKLLIATRYYDATLNMLIPLFGKTGTTVPSDIAVAATIAASIAGGSGAFFANDLKTKLSKKQTAIGMIFVLLSVLYLLWSTTAYSDKHPKRLWIQHVHREYRNIPFSDRKHYTSLLPATTIEHDQKNSEPNSVRDYGLWVMAFDSQGMYPIQKYLNRFLHTQKSEGHQLEDGNTNFQKVACEDSNGHCYTQFPWYFPVAEVLKDSYYLATKQPPKIPKSQTFHLLTSTHPFTISSHQQQKGVTRLVEIILIGPSHIHLVLRNSPTTSQQQQTIQDRIVRWYLNDSLSSSLETVQEAHQIYKTSSHGNGEKPQYSPEKLKAIEKKLERESISPMRSEKIYFFEVGFGLCPHHHCMKRIYVEIAGNEPIDVIAYGHYVEEAKIGEKKTLLARSSLDREEDTVEDAIDSFVDLLPNWSKGSEWTKFPSYLIVERI